MKSKSIVKALHKRNRAAAVVLAALMALSAPIGVFAASSGKANSASVSTTAAAASAANSTSAASIATAVTANSNAGSSPSDSLTLVSALPSIPSGGGGAGGPGGADTQDYDYTGTYSASLTADGMTVTNKSGTAKASAADKNAALAQNGGTLKIDGTLLKKSGSDENGDNCNFYGVNSILLSAGKGSKAYISGSMLTASGSQIAGMEGLNTIRIKDSTLTSTNDAKTGSDPIKNGVIIYQSTSGDADTESSDKADFEAENSSLITSITSGAMFYVTNTTAKVVLKSTSVQTGSDKVDLIRAVGNDSNNWGAAGSNGARLTFTAMDEDLTGDIVADTISSVKFYLLDGSTYKGSTKIQSNYAGSTSGSHITMNIAKGSTWVVTSSCKVSTLNAEAGSKIVDESGKTVSIIANGKTVVKGTSPYKITVTGKYGTSFKTGSDNKLSKMTISRSAFNDYFGLKTSTQRTTASETDTSSEAAGASSSNSGSSASSGNIFARFIAWVKGLFN